MLTVTSVGGEREASIGRSLSRSESVSDAVDLQIYSYSRNLLEKVKQRYAIRITLNGDLRVERVGCNHFV